MGEVGYSTASRAVKTVALLRLSSTVAFESR